MAGWWGLGVSSMEGTLTWRTVCGQRARTGGGGEGAGAGGGGVNSQPVAIYLLLRRLS